MRQSLFLLVGLVVLTSAFFFLSTSESRVSPETLLRDREERTLIQEGVSPDGMLAIIRVESQQSYSARSWVMDRSRSARLVRLPSPDGRSGVFLVERARPRERFEVRGNFFVSPETTLTWVTPTKFLVCTKDEWADERVYAVNLSGATLTDMSGCSIACRQSVSSI